MVPERSAEAVLVAQEEADEVDDETAAPLPEEPSRKSKREKDPSRASGVKKRRLAEDKLTEEKNLLLSELPSEANDLNRPRPHTMTTELMEMMYGFGDSANPLKESVDLVEDMVIEFIQDVIGTALETLPRRNKALGVEHLEFAVRRDIVLLHRGREMIRKEREIKSVQREAKKGVDNDALDEDDFEDE